MNKTRNGSGNVANAKRKPDASNGPTGILADNFRRELRQIVSKKDRPGFNIDQFVADIENIDALKTNRPDWIRQLEEEGAVRLKRVSTTELFADRLAEKKRLERIRDGLTALQSAFDAMLPERRRELAKEAFCAAKRVAEEPDKALLALLGSVLTGVKGAIAELSKSTPSSATDLRRQTAIVMVAAIFHRHGLPIGVGPKSPYIKVCELVGVARATVQKYIPQIKPNLDRHLKDLYGD